ncbi:MAG: glycoside hydrolase family 3 N-terminal domain-containing protein, partial [Eubacteriales bacterium]
MKRIIRTLLLVLCVALLLKPAQATPEAEGQARVDALLNAMTLDQRISQMIMPALLTWDGEKVTELSAWPTLAEALRRHQYGGVILFGANIASTEQTVRLIDDLQRNNAQSAPGALPYLVAADQEGGYVARLTMGTRGTGSMAIGATGEAAEQNALATGQVFGEELAALGINVNLGPCIDVIIDPADPGMSTRVFSDDPQVVSRLGLAFAEGVGQSNVITCFKHFPGAGDGSDNPTSIKLTSDQLAANGLAAYRAAIEGGAEMVMVSATTFPLIDDEILMADGVTRGHWPATLSPRIVTGLLRDELGFDGVVMTDALEMQQFVTEPDTGAALFSGEYATVAHDVQVAWRAINAGCDILLLPRSLNTDAAVQYYDDYIAGIAALVERGDIESARIDASVRRILALKERHGLLDQRQDPLDQRIEAAGMVVGSQVHHGVEMAIARQAVTLLKNDGVLPITGGRVVILGRTATDNTPISYALALLRQGGFVDPDIRIENRITGETTGGEDASTVVVIDRYYNDGELAYTDDLTEAIVSADVVVCLSNAGEGLDRLQDDNPQILGVRRALLDAREGGARFVLLSDNLPVDTTRFQDADAIVCAFMSSGSGVDPMAPTGASGTAGAFNANIPAALCAIFGDGDMPGRLPINIPALERDSDGRWVYGDTLLYERGQGG